jgi:hypothetical protein
LQEGIRRARASAGAAGGVGPSKEGAAYQDAIADVARATRELVDYEDQIPDYEREYRQHVGARLTRWAGGVLAGLCAALALAILPGAVQAPWLFLSGPLFLAGVMVLPGARSRAADVRSRPRLGAWLFAIAAVVAVLCCGGAVPAWTSPVALVAAWLGLRAFGVVTPATPAARAGYGRTGADT